MSDGEMTLEGRARRQSSCAVALGRVRDAFLAPADPAAAAPVAPVARVAERSVPATLGVLVAPPQAAAAGAVLALAAAGGSSCALVCRWTGEAAGVPLAPASAPAVGAARRLAARLSSRGLEAAARGRLVTLHLPAAPDAARDAAERAAAAAGDAPTVLVIAGARPPSFDALLAEADRLVVVASPGAPSVLEHLAIEDAARVGRCTGVLRLSPSAALAHRLTVATGLLLSPPLRAAAQDALGVRRGR
jgi:hypothetical protein